jgi:hypothetical protein
MRWRDFGEPGTAVRVVQLVGDAADDSPRAGRMPLQLLTVAHLGVLAFDLGRTSLQ